MSTMRKTILVALAALLVLPLAVNARAEDEERARIRPEGVAVQLGVVLPDDADAGLLVGGVFDLGSVWQPWLNLSAGISRWSSDLEAASYGGRSGSMTDLRLATNLGIELMEVSGIQGYAKLGVGAHFLDFEIPGEAEVSDALGGTNIGGEMAYGLASTRGSMRISMEIRREFVDDAAGWVFAAGVGTRWGQGSKSKVNLY